MTELLALASSVFYGGADFLGGLATRRERAWVVTAWSQLLGLPALGVGLVVVGASNVGVRDLLLGAAGGLSGLFGLVLFYRALAGGRMAVAAPITGAVGAAVPVLVDFASGTRLTSVQWGGVGLAIGATLVIGIEHLSDLSEPVLGKAVMAGMGFAGFFVAFHATTPASGLAPLVAARVVTISLAFLIAARGHTVRLARRSDLRLLAAVGTLDMIANLTATLAVQRGVLGISAVLSSLYPAVTVVIAALALREHPTLRQWLGVGAAVAAVAALSL